MQNASPQATGEAMPTGHSASLAPSPCQPGTLPVLPLPADPALAAVRALPVNAAGLVHDALNAMLARTAPRFPAGR